MNRPLPNILSKIKETKIDEIDFLKKCTSEPLLHKEAEKACATTSNVDFFKAVASKNQKQSINLIAEVKKASPSKGVIRKNFDPVDIAQDYESGGASAISCLTDKLYFQGDISYLQKIKERCKLPVLRKDFIISTIQIAEAKIYAADAILLIARMLESSELKEYINYAESLGMSVLCEIHDETDLEKALKAEASLIGINNRDLDTFMVNKELCLTLRKYVPETIPVVAESGIFTSEDMKKLADNGICAALVGESLMRQENISEAVKNLLRLA